MIFIWSLVLLLIPFATCSSFNFIEVNVDEDLTEPSQGEVSVISQLPCTELNLSSIKPSPIPSFVSVENKDVDVISSALSDAPQIISVNVDLDPFLVSRILSAESSSATFLNPGIYGTYSSFAGEPIFFSFPFKRTRLQNAEIVDYEALYADPIPLPSIPLPNSFHTPPRGEESSRKRIKTPATPFNADNAVQRRCSTALKAFRRKVNVSASGLTPLQIQFNSVLGKLSYAEFTAKEFHGFEEDFNGHFLLMIRRCPEEFLLPAMLYSIMNVDSFARFVQLYQTIDYWEFNSRRFVLTLLRGILLLPQTSEAAVSYFKTKLNPDFFWNHANISGIRVGCFHFDQVVSAFNFAFQLGGVSDKMNSVASWLKSELIVPEFSATTPLALVKGFLSLLHQSRCLFQSDEQHLNYTQDFFVYCMDRFHQESLNRSTVIDTFIRSNMLRLLLKRAVAEDDREFIVVVLRYVVAENGYLCISTRPRYVDLCNDADGEFKVEIEDPNTYRITKYRVV